MGFLDKMFGSKEAYPELDPSSQALHRLERFRDQIETLSEQSKQRLEVIPGDERAFVFIGKPPKKFGIAWIEEGEIKNLKALVDQNHLSPQQAQAVAERLRKIYEENQQDERYSATVGDHRVVVTPSDEFRMQVKEVIQETLH